MRPDTIRTMPKRPGRPRKVRGELSKLTVDLNRRQFEELDRLVGELERETGGTVTRQDVLRAMIEASIEERGAGA